MSLSAKITTGVALLVLVVLAAFVAPALGWVRPLTPGSVATPSPSIPLVMPTAASTPTPTGGAEADAPLTELPDWAKTGSLWLIYPDGFECVGTEGCPNDYRALIGEPGDVLPDGVEYYDPAKHDYNPATNTGFVFPAEH